MILADLGAEVIKVERPPAGDPARVAFPGMFDGINRNKKSVSLNLKEEKDRSALRRLIEKSDVFLEGFRPGVIDRLGFGRDEVLALNKKIIYCSISGFGQTGPYRDLPGHDANYLAVAGALSISGDPKGGPQPWGGMQIADLSSSMYAAVAVLAALRHREQTGEGAYIDVSMTDCVLAWMSPRIGEYFGRNKPPKEKFMGRSGYGAYRAGDGKYLALGCVEDHFWQNLCKAMGLDDMAREERYATWARRMELSGEINAVLNECFLKKTRNEWLDLLGRADVPCSPVNSIEELEEDPYILSRGLFSQVNNTPVIAFPVRFEGVPVREIGPGPKLGEHNDILGEFEE
jgi:crotonobetainyl-CoA:carnitine CoA-transferase CaiB-like acyl-CoA transferase